MIHNRCLRVKSVRHYRDTICAAATPIITTQTTYCWYDSLHAFPLLKIDSTNSSLAGASKTVLYSTLGLGIDELNQPKIDATIFPNPNNGTFTLNYFLAATKSELIIRDVTGRAVYSQQINGMEGRETINISSLGQGIYFWELNAANEVSAKGKLTVIK